MFLWIQNNNWQNNNNNAQNNNEQNNVIIENTQKNDSLNKKNEPIIVDMELTPIDFDENQRVSRNIIIKLPIKEVFKQWENAILLINFVPWKYDVSKKEVIEDKNYNWELKAIDVNGHEELAESYST